MTHLQETQAVEQQMTVWEHALLTIAGYIRSERAKAITCRFDQEVREAPPCKMKARLQDFLTVTSVVRNPYLPAFTYTCTDSGYISTILHQCSTFGALLPNAF